MYKSTMKKNYLFYFILSAFVVVATSCSLQKRHYRKGYQVQWYNQESNNLVDTKSLDYTHESLVNQEDESSNLTASLTKSDVFIPQKKAASFSHPQIKKSCERTSIIADCDIIVQRNGQEISAKVTEFGIHQIKYKKCDDIDGQELAINKSEVATIKYADGRREVIPMEYDKPKYESNKSLSKKEQDVGLIAGLSLALGILSLLIPFIGIILGMIAISTGLFALKEYKRNGANDQNIRRIALAGIWLGLLGFLFWIGISIWLLALLFSI
jgi:hypothetical protein